MQYKKFSSRIVKRLLLFIVAITVLQYVQNGNVTWPQQAWHWATGSVGEYANRPDAAWRRAADKIDELGANREGNPVPEFDLRGRVVRVADGDTLSLLDSHGTQYKIRLYGIDTPEREQAHGKVAMRALKQLVDGRTVGIVVVDTDSYGRKVGTVYRGDNNINLALVTAGHAWWYRRHAQHERQLEYAERQARKEKRGLWAASEPLEPWQWRREQRYQKQ